MVVIVACIIYFPCDFDILERIYEDFIRFQGHFGF